MVIKVLKDLAICILLRDKHPLMFENLLIFNYCSQIEFFQTDIIRKSAYPNRFYLQIHSNSQRSIVLWIFQLDICSDDVS